MPVAGIQLGSGEQWPAHGRGWHGHALATALLSLKWMLKACGRAGRGDQLLANAVLSVLVLCAGEVCSGCQSPQAQLKLCSAMTRTLKRALHGLPE